MVRVGNAAVYRRLFFATLALAYIAAASNPSRGTSGSLPWYCKWFAWVNYFRANPAGRAVVWLWVSVG